MHVQLSSGARALNFGLGLHLCAYFVRVQAAKALGGLCRCTVTGVPELLADTKRNKKKLVHVAAQLHVSKKFIEAFL